MTKTPPASVSVRALPDRPASVLLQAAVAQCEAALSHKLTWVGPASRPLNPGQTQSRKRDTQKVAREAKYRKAAWSYPPSALRVLHNGVPVNDAEKETIFWPNLDLIHSVNPCPIVITKIGRMKSRNCRQNMCRRFLTVLTSGFTVEGRGRQAIQSTLRSSTMVLPY